MTSGAAEMDLGVHTQVPLPHQSIRTSIDPAPRADAELVVAATGLEQRAVTAYERWVKPTYDRLVAALAILVLAPLLAVVAAAVAVSLGRPVLLRQERVGLRGDVIEVLKFRSMRPDRRERPRTHYEGVERRRTHKHPDDPRLTTTGRYIRRWSLDELPQLWNVVRGDMSLVGPRPELVPIVEHYESWQHRRHLVRPGLTGRWQVTERGSRQPMHERVEVDLDYIASLSLRQDLGILARTLPSMLGGGRGH